GWAMTIGIAITQGGGFSFWWKKMGWASLSPWGKGWGWGDKCLPIGTRLAWFADLSPKGRDADLSPKGRDEEESVHRLLLNTAAARTAWAMPCSAISSAKSGMRVLSTKTIGRPLASCECSRTVQERAA